MYVNYKKKKTKEPGMLQITGENFNIFRSKEIAFMLTMTEDGTNGRK